MDAGAIVLIVVGVGLALLVALAVRRMARGRPREGTREAAPEPAEALGEPEAGAGPTARVEAHPAAPPPELAPTLPSGPIAIEPAPAPAAEPVVARPAPPPAAVAERAHPVVAPARVPPERPWGDVPPERQRGDTPRPLPAPEPLPAEPSPAAKPPEPAGKIAPVRVIQPVKIEAPRPAEAAKPPAPPPAPARPAAGARPEPARIAPVERVRLAPVEPARLAPVDKPAPAPRDERRAEERRALRAGLAKTRGGLFSRLSNVFRQRQIPPDLLDRLEETMLTSDVGVKTTQKLLDAVRTGLSRNELSDPDAVFAFLRDEAARLLSVGAPPLDMTRAKPFVVLVVGVNGTGKTTTIGKMAARLRANGRSVVVAAGDTFRAAAVEQLEIWAHRTGAKVVKPQREGADPSSVAFDAVRRAQDEGADVVITDTAGRLHTKTDLMQELGKVRRVLGKAMEGAPHETLLVLDATTGQNAVQQARMFRQAIEVSGAVLTKLDGTARGGVILAVTDELQIPVRFVGVGERVEDLREFDADAFADALFLDAEQAAESAGAA